MHREKSESLIIHLAFSKAEISSVMLRQYVT